MQFAALMIVRVLQLSLTMKTELITLSLSSKDSSFQPIFKQSERHLVTPPGDYI